MYRLRRNIQMFVTSVVCSTFAFIASAGGGESVNYRTQIKPLLAEKCYSCHGVLKQQSELRLETRALMIAGGESGPVIEPGDARASVLYQRVTADADERMPPAGEGTALNDEEARLVKLWIDQGAIAPEEPTPSAPRRHWAFQRIERPQLPVSKKARHAIDALLDAKRRDLGLTAQPAGARSILLRRLYLDLIGIPPTREQLHDRRPWEGIVDELLASPQHGERWARHWMDVWRYSDWYGLGAQLRYSQKHIWHWRDWIIDSLNEDKGYDQMILEMLAGDELAPDNPRVLRATGFLARNYYLFNRTTWLDSTIEHTGKAFLGLTLNCAKCHDHKFDPISQRDYYQFRAIFEPHQIRLDQVPGEIDLERGGLPRAFDDHLDIPTYLHLRGDEKNPDTETAIEPSVPKLFAEFAPPIEPVALPVFAYAPGVRDYVQQDRLKHVEKSLAEANNQLVDAQQRLEIARSNSLAKVDSSAMSPATNAAGGKEDPQRAVDVAKKKQAAWEAESASLNATIAADNARLRGPVSVEQQTKLANEAAKQQAIALIARAQHELLLAGDDEGKQKAAEEKLARAEKQLARAEEGTAEYEPLKASRKALETPEHSFDDYPGVFPQTSTGRRLALARWMIARDNPLTARVAVNQVWMRHFGRPLVESVFDFGLRAPRPVHADLLDFLAAEFIDSGWSFRHLHRLIVTSEAYQQSSATADANEATVSNDPDNRFYWHMSSRRMESQLVRDSLLSLAGKLDSSIGGPSLQANQPNYRRSLYFIHSGNEQNKFLSMFDDADLFQCYRRTDSIVPQQALALSNSRLALAMAGEIATHISHSDPGMTRAEFIRAGFETLLARLPTAAEQQACESYCRQLGRLGSVQADQQLVRKRLTHALLNHNDFISIR